MTRIIAIMSGKGGVGKTTTTLNLGVAMAGFGQRSIVVDTSFQNPHLGIHLGTSKPDHTIHQVLKGQKQPKQALYSHASGMQVMPGDVSLEALEEINLEGLGRMLNDLQLEGDIILLDTSPGFGKETQEIIKHAQDIIIVTTPELPAVADAIRLQKLLRKIDHTPAGIILNMVRGDSIEMTKKNIETLLGVPVIGIIPHDEAVRKALHLRQPVSHTHPTSKSTIGFKNVAARLLGQQYVDSLEKKEDTSLFNHTLKRLGL